MFLIEQYRYDVIIIFSDRVAVSYRHWLPCHSNALVHSENLARSRSRQLFQQSRLLLWSCDTIWIEINNFLHFFAYQQFKCYNCFWCPQCAMFCYQNTHCRVFWGFFFPLPLTGCRIPLPVAGSDRSRPRLQREAGSAPDIWWRRNSSSSDRSSSLYTGLA